MGEKRPVRIAIDPELLITRGPEIHWTWRLLLTTCGYTWEEVSLEDECEIAYTLDPNRVTAAKICIVGDKRLWQNPGNYSLKKLTYSDHLPLLCFGEVNNTEEIIHTEVFDLLCNHDTIFQIFWLTTGQYEQYLDKTKHGFIVLNGNSQFPKEILLTAPISQTVAWFREKIFTICGIEPEKLWFGNYCAAACSGHDVDYPEIMRLLEPVRIIRRQGISGFLPSIKVLSGKYTHWHFQSWIEVEKSLGFRSAFYFVAQQGSIFKYLTGTPDPFYNITSDRFQEIFEILKDEGFEIGLQASYKAYQSRERFSAEKETLEKAAGKAIFGNRHHYYHLNPVDMEDTLLIHEQINLLYDASICHNDYLGWRRGICHPYFPFHQGLRRELTTLQIPSAWMDDQLFGLKKHNPGDRNCLLENLVQRTSENEGCLYINVHEYVFENDLFPGWAKSYIDLWQYINNKGNFWIATPLEIAQYWTRRYQSILAASWGLRLGML